VPDTKAAKVQTMTKTPHGEMLARVLFLLTSFLFILVALLVSIFIVVTELGTGGWEARQGMEEEVEGVAGRLVKGIEGGKLLFIFLPFEQTVKVFDSVSATRKACGVVARSFKKEKRKGREKEERREGKRERGLFFFFKTFFFFLSLNFCWGCVAWALFFFF